MILVADAIINEKTVVVVQLHTTHTLLAVEAGFCLEYTAIRAKCLQSQAIIERAVNHFLEI